MSDLNFNFDSTEKKISLDGDNSDTGINLKTEPSAMLGIDLLTNKETKSAELNVTSDITGGYSSGEDSVKSHKSQTKSNISQNTNSKTTTQ